MDLPVNRDELTHQTSTHQFLPTLFRTLMRVVCSITIVVGVIFGVLGWQDYADAPHGGYTLIQNPDGSDSGYLNPKTGQFTAGAPPSRIRDFFEQAKRFLLIDPARPAIQSRTAEPASPTARANNSSQRPAHVGEIAADMSGRYQSGDYELIISHVAGSAKGTVNLSLLAHNTEVFTATATRVGDNIRFYKDQTHDCPLTISRFNDRLVFVAVGGAKHCGDLSMTGFYYAP